MSAYTTIRGPISAYDQCLILIELVLTVLKSLRHLKLSIE